MVDLDLCFQSDAQGHEGLTAHRCSFCICFSPPYALFCHDHTTKPGMKDLLEVQQWWVERFEPDTAAVQAECSNHYTMLPQFDDWT